MKLLIVFLLSFSVLAEEKIVDINLKNQELQIGESVFASLEDSTFIPKKKGVYGCVYLSNINSEKKIALATLVKGECKTEQTKEKIFVRFNNANVSNLQKKMDLDGQLTFLDESYYMERYSTIYWIIIILVILAVIYLVFFRNKSIEKLIEIKKFDIKRIKKNRKEIELAYKHRNAIMDDIDNRLKAQQVFNFINKIQFKKSWTEDELEQAYKGIKEFKFRERL